MKGGNMVTLSNYGYGAKFIEDSFNLGGRRNQSNTACPAYNCGGFALGTFSWYVPFAEDMLDYAVEVGAIKERYVEEILEGTSEDDYYWEEQDFLENYRLPQYNLNDHSMNCLLNYESWSSIQICKNLEAIYPNLFEKNSMFLDYFARKIVSENKGVRPITALSELRPNEYCIAFRIGDGDFHFLRSNDSRCQLWIEKRGTTKVLCHRADEIKYSVGSEKFFNVLFKTRIHFYNSKTLLFAKRNGGKYESIISDRYGRR